MLHLPYKVILCSASPRRQELLKTIVPDFEIRIKEVDESFPDHLQGERIALFLALQKARAFEDEIKPGELMITADTIVWRNDKALNKPSDRNDAIRMLKELSGQEHRVYTGVCVFTHEKKKLFYGMTRVFFKPLSTPEIEYYVDNFAPYDKAGAYGAQDFIGMVGVEKIEGGFYNVMGLPMKELYEELQHFDD
jgi:nucleoside triphosphate pyrophosphatase